MTFLHFRFNILWILLLNMGEVFFFLKKQSFDDSLDLKPETLFSLFPSGTVFCVSFPPVRAGALVFLKTGSPGWMHVFHAVSQTSREPTGIWPHDPKCYAGCFFISFLAGFYWLLKCHLVNFHPKSNSLPVYLVWVLLPWTLRTCCLQTSSYLQKSHRTTMVFCHPQASDTRVSELNS